MRNTRIHNTTTTMHHTNAADEHDVDYSRRCNHGDVDDSQRNHEDECRYDDGGFMTTTTALLQTSMAEADTATTAQAQ